MSEMRSANISAAWAGGLAQHGGTSAVMMLVFAIAISLVFSTACYAAGLADLIGGTAPAVSGSASATSATVTPASATPASATSATVTPASATPAATSATAAPASTSAPAVTSVEAKASVEDYTWDELAFIADQISASGSGDAAIAIAEKYNLCTPDGKLDGTQTKSVTLSDGTQTSVQIAGFYHDDKSDGTGKAGITFIFTDSIASHAMNVSGANAGGWQASEMRSWLGSVVSEELPADLVRNIVPVNKMTNNVGDTYTAKSVSMSEDRLWLFSSTELCGDIEWYIARDTFYDDVLNAEGYEYQLFSDCGVINGQANTSNALLTKNHQGTICRWWVRSPQPNANVGPAFCAVTEVGDPESFDGSYVADGVVPGFCIGGMDDAGWAKNIDVACGSITSGESALTCVAGEGMTSYVASDSKGNASLELAVLLPGNGVDKAVYEDYYFLDDQLVYVYTVANADGTGDANRYYFRDGKAVRYVGPDGVVHDSSSEDISAISKVAAYLERGDKIVKETAGSGGGSAVAASSSVEPKASLEEYSWDEIAAIGAQIAASGSEEAAIGIAEKYNLCTSDGRLDGTQTKSVTLSDGTQTSVQIAGFYHDDCTDGTGKAGITFIFTDAIAMYAMGANTEGGWEYSDLRIWLASAVPELPEDLIEHIVAVDKVSNNAGATRDTSCITATSDRLWLFSAVELQGTGGMMIGTDESSGPVMSAQGYEYQLFSDCGVADDQPNAILAKSYQGSSCAWWSRSVDTDTAGKCYAILDNGYLYSPGGADYRVGTVYGVVPGFCVGTAADYVAPAGGSSSAGSSTGSAGSATTSGSTSSAAASNSRGGLLGGLIDALVSGPVSISEGTFPDSAFRTYVSQHLDTDADGMLSQEEQDAVTQLGAYDTSTGQDVDPGLSGLGITDLTGIRYFKNLTSLVVSNNDLTSLDLSSNTALTYLDVTHNRGLTSLDLTANTALTSVRANAACQLTGTPATASVTLLQNGIAATALSEDDGITYAAKLGPYGKVDANGACGLAQSPFTGDYLIADGGYIYGSDDVFPVQDVMDTTIWRSRPDGSERVAVAQVQGIAADYYNWSGFYKLGDTIIVNSEPIGTLLESVVSYPAAGGDATTIITDAHLCGFDANGYVYYTKNDKSGIYRADTDFTHEVFFCEAGSYGATVCSDGAFVMSASTTDGSAKWTTVYAPDGSPVIDDTAFCIDQRFEYEGYLYYLTGDSRVGQTSLSRMSIADGTVEDLSSQMSFDSNWSGYDIVGIIDGTIYYLGYSFDNPSVGMLYSHTLG